MSKTWTHDEWRALFPQVGGKILKNGEYKDCVFIADAGTGTIDSEDNPVVTNPTFVGRNVVQYRAYDPADLTTPLQCDYGNDLIYTTKVIMNFNFSVLNCSYLLMGFWGYLYPEQAQYAATSPAIYEKSNSWKYDLNDYIYTSANASSTIQLVTPSGSVWPNRVAATQALITSSPATYNFKTLQIAPVGSNDTYGSVFGIILPITNDGAAIVLGRMDIPFSGGSESDIGGGSGTFTAPSNDRGDDSGTTVLNIFKQSPGVGLPSVVTKHNTAVYGGGINVYKVGDGDMATMINILYNGNFIDKWQLSKYNPLTAILSRHLIPSSLCPITYNGGAAPTYAVTAAGYNFFTDPSGGLTPMPYETRIDTIGVSHIGHFNFQKYFDAYPDFAPYTKVYLHLPYCGTLDIDTNAVMHGYIAVDYVCDVLNGNLCVYVTCSDRSGRTQIKYKATGNCAYSLPMFAEFQSGAEMGKLLTNFVGGMLSAATGGGVGQIMSAGTGMLEASMIGVQHNTQVTGNISGNVGMITDTQCVLEIVRPQWINPTDYDTLNGIPIMAGGTLADLGCTGFVVLDRIETDGITATEPEIREIERLVKQGVYIVPTE